VKKISLYVMAVVYIVAGINHFIHPEAYLRIMPPWLKWHHAMITVSGVFEILFGLLVAVFPANIQMMLNYLHENNARLWIAILRMPLQFVLIWWAYLFTKPIPWKGSKY